VTKPPLRAVFFDLDQTLTDRARSIEVVSAKLREAFPQHCGNRSVDFIRDAVLSLDAGGYRPRAEFCEMLTYALTWPMPAKELEAWWRKHFPACAVEATGAAEVLAALDARGLRLGIVTNGAESTQQAKIDVLGFRRFLSTVQVSEAVGVKKPDPEIFFRALKEAGVSAAEAVFVGDHPENDVIGATRAGMRAIWVAGMCRWPNEFPKPVLQILGLHEILTLVE
jgi:putative hydrolase of the HAD superfamily